MISKDICLVKFWNNANHAQNAGSHRNCMKSQKIDKNTLFCVVTTELQISTSLPSNYLKIHPKTEVEVVLETSFYVD